MRKLYVCAQGVWLKHHRSGVFHPMTGSDYIDLPDGMVLLSAGFSRASSEESFASDPDVAALPDPIFEGSVKMKDYKDNPVKTYKDKHHQALAAIGVGDSDTVLDVSKKAQAICKSVCIRHIL